jgi:hypothetical protein
MDAGTYSNHANVLQGYLKTLGLNRQSRPTETLHDMREQMMRAEPERMPTGPDPATASAATAAALSVPDAANPSEEIAAGTPLEDAP